MAARLATALRTGAGVVFPLADLPFVFLVFEVVAPLPLFFFPDDEEVFFPPLVFFFFALLAELDFFVVDFFEAAFFEGAVFFDGVGLLFFALFAGDVDFFGVGVGDLEAPAAFFFAGVGEGFAATAFFTVGLEAVSWPEAVGRNRRPGKSAIARERRKRATMRKGSGGAGRFKRAPPRPLPGRPVFPVPGAGWR